MSKDNQLKEVEVEQREIEDINSRIVEKVNIRLGKTSSQKMNIGSTISSANQTIARISFHKDDLDEFHEAVESAIYLLEKHIFNLKPPRTRFNFIMRIACVTMFSEERRTKILCEFLVD